MIAACLKSGRKLLGRNAATEVTCATQDESNESSASPSTSAPAEEIRQQVASEAPIVLVAPVAAPAPTSSTATEPAPAVAVRREQSAEGFNSTELSGGTNASQPASIAESELPEHGQVIRAENKTMSLSSNGLNNEASQSLRKYAKRNKPNKEKFMTSPGLRDERKRSFTPEQNVSLLSSPPGTIDEVTKATPSEMSEGSKSTKSTIEEKMIGVLLVKYDLFEEIDAERLKEFDDLFLKVKKTSNYEAHKRKTAKMNKSKFNTACAVCTDEDTGDTKIT